MTITRTTEQLPAGTYVVSDLCYILGANDTDWMAHVRAIFDDPIYARKPSRENATTHLNWNGKLVATASTAWGDGQYYDNYSRKYLVDSGSIGCAPIEMLKGQIVDGNKWLPEGYDSAEGCHVVKFSEPFVVTHNEGVIHFGDELEIDTDPEEDDYDWDEEE